MEPKNQAAEILRDLAELEREEGNDTAAKCFAHVSFLLLSPTKPSTRTEKLSAAISTHAVIERLEWCGFDDAIIQVVRTFAKENQ
jgi:hypothetical protein